MTKKELYNELKADGAKLRAINSYNLETLQEMYDERFGEPAPQGEPSYDSAREHDEFPPFDSLEKHDADSTEEPEEDTMPEEETPRERTYSREEPLPEEIHTLYFTGGGWCEETQSSYAPGFYRPATYEEYLALRRFAAKEL